jgi:transposase InsO family protein
MHLLSVMTSARYGHLPPKQLVPRLADEGTYLASESTMYRLQKRLGGRAHRRPVLCTYVTRGAMAHRATRSNQLWSWDITYLPTTIRGRFLRLYLVMDVWSRRIVGWEVHEHEVATHAATLIQRICTESGVDPRGLVWHSDNGKPMRGRTMVATLQWLGIVPSFSRPHVCNDNPYSEALFRTLKHTPAYPRLPFADGEAARLWVARFVGWYNTEHHHSGIRYVTPDERHSGADVNILTRRHVLYQQARRRKPERWPRNTRNWTPLGTVVLNPEPSHQALETV